MAESRKIPAIRFKGFNEAWEQRKLGDLSEIMAGGTPSTQIDSYWMPKEIPWLSSGEVHKKRITYTDNMISKIGLENSSARWIKENSVLIALAGQGKTRGTVAINRIPLTTNQSIAAIILNKELHCEFVFQNLENRYDELRTLSSADGSRGGLNKQILSELNIRTPQFEEQQNIGLFFKNLDNLITLHQRKLLKIKNIKKALLEKMFPQNGQSTPEIRFSGFTDAWEQRKLGEFGKTTGGTSIESEFNEGGKYKVISIGSYSEMSNYTDQGIRADKTNKTESRILNKDDLTMILNDKTASGNIIGRVLHIDADNTYIYNQRTERIEVNKNEYEPRFLYQLLNADNIRSKIIRASQGNTQIYVNWSAISEIKYAVPLLKSEQKQIGVFFDNLDNLITLRQRKLDKLNNIKKACLEKMFI